MADREKNRGLYEIRIRKGREYRAAIEPERVNSPTEFFSSAYQEAKVQLREILLASLQIGKRETKGLLTKEKIQLLREYPNNVIAFCADRGRGKTTAMLSFSNALEALSDPPKSGSATSLFWGDIATINDDLQNIRFEVLSPVDPAAMENSESVLQQIISQMFENVCKKINYRVETGVDNRAFDDISDKFQKCAQAIDSLYKDPKTRTSLIEDELEQIAEMGESAKLLLLLHELVDRYLDFMCGKDAKRCLVVQIDDADMDIGRAYQILEDMRKYLGLPWVIVLMATNIQQLETTVEQHFLQEYEHGLKYFRSMITVERCHDIAALYLEKAIPHTRRIYLPDIDKTIRQHLSQIRVVYEDKDKDTDKNKEENNILTSDGAYQKQLLELLCRKTGMVFTFEEDYLHNLLPKHLRELSQFLSFFSNMKDLSDGYKLAAEIFINQGFPEPEKNLQELEQWEKNLGRLELYLVNLWSATNLRENSRNLFLEFAAQPEPIRNLFLLRNIADYYAQEQAALESTHSELMWDESDCRNEFIRACELQGISLPSYPREMQGVISASYADVMGAMTVLTNLPGGNRQYRFAYAVRLFYSIRLHIALIQEIRALGEGVPTDPVTRLQTINFQTITDILQGTLLKLGQVNDTERTPFGRWILEMPVQWFQTPLFFEEHALYGKENPFLRWKYRDGNTVYTASTLGPEGIPGVWRPIVTPTMQRDSDVVVFSPLYPLLAALDQLIRFQGVGSMREDPKGQNIYRSQIYIALLVCLNWDVQRVLFKKIKTQPNDTAIKMAVELYTRYIADLAALIPREAPSWLEAECFNGTWEGTNRDIFDVLTMRVHPAPEFRTYLRNANEGLTEFEQALSALNIWSKRRKAKSTKLSLLRKTANDNLDNGLSLILDQMDEAVGNVLSSVAVSRRIEEVAPKDSDNPLHILLTDYLHKSKDKNHPQFSSQNSSLTPTKLKNALTTYTELLEQLLRCGADTSDGKSVERQLEPTMTGVPHEDFPIEAPVPTNDREAAAKTLQDLLQLGHQLLSVLTSPQQESPSEQDK